MRKADAYQWNINMYTNMSIPTNFNPLGTMGAVNELPYVQPVKTGNGLMEHSNEPTFGFAISYIYEDTGWHAGEYAWHAFTDDITEGKISITFGQINKVNRFAITFPEGKYLKVKSVSCIRPTATDINRGPYTLTLVGVRDDGAEDELGSVYLEQAAIDGLPRYEIVVEKPAFYHSYKFVFTDLRGWLVISNIILNAVYKQ